MLRGSRSPRSRSPDADLAAGYGGGGAGRIRAVDPCLGQLVGLHRQGAARVQPGASLPAGARCSSGSRCAGPERFSGSFGAWLGGIVIVCAVALITRLLPNVWPIGANLANDRLSYPITYWNALGLLAALGIVFSLHMATRARGPRTARVLGAAAVPLLATTIYFTFSRGAILAGVIGTVVYLVLARPRGTVSGLAATAPATAIVLVVAYHADLLATQHPTIPAAVTQGHRVAWVLAACTVGAALIRLACLRLDARVSRMRHIIDPRTARVAAGGVVVVTVAVALALGAPGWVRAAVRHLRPRRTGQRGVAGSQTDRLSQAADLCQLQRAPGLLGNRARPVRSEDGGGRRRRNLPARLGARARLR